MFRGYGHYLQMETIKNSLRVPLLFEMKPLCGMNVSSCAAAVANISDRAACLGTHLTLVIAAARNWSGKMMSLVLIALPCMLCGAAVVPCHGWFVIM